jgi:hypothetical protein
MLAFALPQRLPQLIARRCSGRCAAMIAVTLLTLATADAADEVQSQPLAARSRPASATMFTEMQPEQTGIVAENSFADPKMWGEHYQEFTLGAMGTGVAAADFDNDGRPDLYVVNKTGPGRLYRNLGNWKFEDVTAKAGLMASGGAMQQGLAWVKSLVGSEGAGDEVGRWNQGAAFADVNNDGWLDLYLCRFDAPNRLYINQRDGTFREEAAVRGLAVLDASGMGAFCDYDRDGWLDVYVLTNMLDAAKQPDGRRDYLFRNRGDGTFVDVTEQAGIYGDTLVHSATWWDFDRDGWPDLYVADDFVSPDRLYRNNRDGTFTDVVHTVVPHMPYSAMGADLGDVNNDGMIDLIVADMAATTHEKDQRTMAAAREMSRADADSPRLASQVPHSMLYLNTGAGRMLEAAQLAGVEATDWTWSPRFEDLDNDGRLDLHITNGVNREYHNVDLRDRIMLTESAAERVRLKKGGSLLRERNLAYRNTGDLRFEEVGQKWGLDQLGVSYGSAFADFDGDGDLDVVFANYEAPATVLRNDSATGHRVILALRGTVSNRFGVGAVARVETGAGVQVRPLVVARGYLSSSEPVLHFGLGEESVIKRLTIEWPSGHTQSFTDLSADRRYTITEPDGRVQPAPPSPVAPGLFVDESERRGLALKTDESFDEEKQPLIPVRFDRRGPALAVGDLDGDHRDDVVLGGTSRQPAQIHKGGEQFASVRSLPGSRVDDGPLLILDANADGRPDLLQTRMGANRPAGSPEYQPVLHLQDADGNFVAAPDVLPVFTSSVGAAAAADFDRDGRLDVFLGGRVVPGRYPSAPRSALLHNLGGRFEDVTEALAASLREVGMVSSALWSDVDQDGWPDLLLALEWGGVKYFHNEGGLGFTDHSERAGFAAAGTGWWTSLGSADFNGDGRPDYVAGNVGLNTPYQPPALLFHGAFGSGNAAQLVEAYHEGDHLLPRRTSLALGAAIPAIKRRFPKNDDYARATLGEILGEDRLAAAKRYEANELRSGVFLSQADGGYRFEAFPRMVQIAPVQGVVTGDFDGDGHLDIYALQNSYAPIPAIGRFDGGLSQLLLGDGRGGFVLAPPLESGLVVPGDAKAVVLLDLDTDGRPDLLVSRNDATTLAWRNRGVEGRRSFRVMLQGPAGNRDAVGAWVELELADGSRRAQALHAGSGYYSQSAPGCFFGYPAANPPRRLVVRWPGGAVTEQTFSAEPPARLVLPAP